MSRESDLRISFPVAESEKELVSQVCDYFKNWSSIDEVSCDENGITFYVWNSEHYYLADVMPLITRIVATIFSDRDIAAEGTGTYSVVDDIHEYSASYNHESKLIFCDWHNYCRGLNRDYGTKYCVLEAGLPATDIKEIKKYAETKGYDLLIDTLNVNMSNLALQTNSNSAPWQDSMDYAIVKHLRNKSNLCVPNELTQIYEEAFENCAKVETITFGDLVRQVDDGAFKNCKNLREVTIPKNIKKIGNNAFANCPSLEKVEIACDLETLPPTLFKNCQSLREVIINGKIKSITKTFQGLTGLENVVLAEGLEFLGAEAFAGCTALERINLPDSLKKISDNAFTGCTKLKLEKPTGIKESNAFDLQEDAVVQAIICVQTEHEAIKLLHFLYELGSFKQYKNLYEKKDTPLTADQQKEYENEIARLREQGKYTIKGSRDICLKYSNKEFYDYREHLAKTFVEATSPEQAKAISKSCFTEKEIQKNNLAIKASAMVLSGYKTKDITATLGAPASLMRNINVQLIYCTPDEALEELLIRLKGIIL